MLCARKLSVVRIQRFATRVDCGRCCGRVYVRLERGDRGAKPSSVLPTIRFISEVQISRERTWQASGDCEAIVPGRIWAVRPPGARALSATLTTTTKNPLPTCWTPRTSSSVLQPSYTRPVYPSRVPLPVARALRPAVCLQKQGPTRASRRLASNSPRPPCRAPSRARRTATHTHTASTMSSGAAAPDPNRSVPASRARPRTHGGASQRSPLLLTRASLIAPRPFPAQEIQDPRHR